MRGALFIVLSISVAIQATSCFADKTLTTSSGTNETEIRSTIQAEYDNSNVAGLKLDVQGMLAPCAPECKFTFADGMRINFATRSADFVVSFQVVKPKSMSSSKKIQSLAIHGQTAVASVNEHQVNVLPNFVSGGTFTQTKDYVFKDTWKLINGSWKKVNSVTLSIKSYRDGKPNSDDTLDSHW